MMMTLSPGFVASATVWKVIELGVVAGVSQRQVGAPQPPIVGHLEREIATSLVAAPAADLLAKAACVAIASRAEDAREGGETVIPVMIAGDVEELALRLVGAERHVIGRQAALGIFLDRGIGVLLRSFYIPGCPELRRLSLDAAIALPGEKKHRYQRR